MALWGRAGLSELASDFAREACTMALIQLLISEAEDARKETDRLEEPTMTSKADLEGRKSAKEAIKKVRTKQSDWKGMRGSYGLTNQTIIV